LLGTAGVADRPPESCGGVCGGSLCPGVVSGAGILATLCGYQIGGSHLPGNFCRDLGLTPGAKALPVDRRGLFCVGFRLVPGPGSGGRWCHVRSPNSGGLPGGTSTNQGDGDRIDDPPDVCFDVWHRRQAKTGLPKTQYGTPGIRKQLSNCAPAIRVVVGLLVARSARI